MSEHLDVAAFRLELLELVGRAVPLHEADVEPESDSELEPPLDGVPTAVLIIVEWQGADGRRWLSSTSALGSGQVAPAWTARMLAREALDWDVQP